jgi:hypothetical protein
MDKFFEEHGTGSDVKSSQPENKKQSSPTHEKPKIPASKNFSQRDNSHGHNTHNK